MLNQAAVEALYSATYIENYIDYVEDAPDEVQRYVSRVRELDLTYVGFLKEMEQQCDALFREESSSHKKNCLLKIQQALIRAQELGDEKLQVMQQVQDLIENKTRQLDLDYRNLADVGKDGDLAEMSKDGSARETGTYIPIGLNNGGSGGERQSKRVRRTRTDLGVPGDISSSAEPTSYPEPAKQNQNSQQSPAANNTLGSHKKGASATITKKKKRKTRQGTQQSSQKDTPTRESQRDREDSPGRDDEMLIDPDEPTYCLCDQISYGEMIMCDNDGCPYEWFHFSCVSLSSKPKGKWYCPKCRGERSSVMKPKAQLLRELERLKQERELKDDKGS